MNRIVVERQLSREGILQLTLSLGAEEAGRDVRVTVEPVIPKKEITPDEWQAGILATAGGWQGEFERPTQEEVGGTRNMDVSYLSFFNAVCNFFSALIGPGVMMTLLQPYPALPTKK